MRLFLSILLFGVIQTAKPASLVEVASRSGQFSTLLKAAVEADLADTLSIDGPFTIFAPTDEAFAELPHGVLSELLKEKNKSQLANLLKYHVVTGSYSSKELPLLPLKTLNGQDVKFTVGSGSVFINGSQVLTADIEASNGVIHVIDKVLIPQKPASLVEVASRSGQFSTLLKAAVEADLADTLSIDGPFTIFAPTDEAFAELPHGVLSELLKEKNKSQLANLLKYHVVTGSYSSKELPLLPLKTLNGQDVKFTVGSGSVFINGSQVLTADIEASNGVIHVIDKVLIPQNSAVTESAKSIIMRGIKMGVPHFNHGNHSVCAEIYEITLRSLLMLPESELSKASREMVSDSLKKVIMMESPTDKAWEARETFDKLLATNTGDSASVEPTEETYESAKSIIMRGIKMGVPHFNHDNHSACAEIYEITLRSLLMLPESELGKASQEMVSDSLKQIIMMESPTDKAWEARKTFDKLLATNTGDSASVKPTEDTYVTMSIIDDGHMMIKWKGHDSVKLQRSSDFRNWQTIDESKGESKLIMRIGSEIEFFRTVKE